MKCYREKSTCITRLDQFISLKYSFFFLNGEEGILLNVRKFNYYCTFKAYRSTSFIFYYFHCISIQYCVCKCDFCAHMVNSHLPFDECQKKTRASKLISSIEYSSLTLKKCNCTFDIPMNSFSTKKNVMDVQLKTTNECQ